MRILITMGTRPEVIKLAPVVKALQAHTKVTPLVLFTGQHRELLDQMASFFGLEAFDDLRVMQENQSLPALTARLITGVDRVLARVRPDAVVVQGDTTTVMATALCCYYRRIPVAHVEAGLRTGDLFRPFPEEGNRRLVAPLCRWHFAPTQTAANNLLREGIPTDRVHVTGNTVIDALLEVAGRDLPLPAGIPRNGRLMLVTLHRRESFGETFRGILRAIRMLLDARSDLHMVYPVHPNPSVQRAAQEILGDHRRARLIAPLDYGDFVTTMKHATLILTDSGGVQEEAPALGVPVLVLRDRTERPEGVEAGQARLVGTSPEAIIRHASELLDNLEARESMKTGLSPYGDGRAAVRIANLLADKPEPQSSS